MYKIQKSFSFSASHQLSYLPAEHQCARLHGHNYVVEVVLQSERLDANSFVVDYGELKAFRLFLDEFFEHRHLNDILKRPTAENLAEYFYGWCKAQWPETSEVRVSETPQTWASYRPSVL